MPTLPSQGSQSWLAGADNSLDNYFKSGGALVSSSSTSKRGSGSRNVSTNVTLGSGSKRKRDISKRLDATNEMNGPNAKRAKTARSGDGDARHSTPPKSKAKGKGKTRQALGDLTSALQNSPHRQRAKDKPKAVIQLDGDSSSDLESGPADPAKRLPALTFGKTPCQPSNKPPNRLKVHLPTPPSSSMLPSRRLVTNERGSSPTSHFTSPKQKQPNSREKEAAQTPFAFTVASSKRGYPTPTSIAVPRLNFTRPINADEPLPAPNLNLDLDSDSPLTSLSSSSPAKSTKSNHDEVIEDRNVHETKTNDAPRVNTAATTPRKARASMYEVVPSSQTQYIHYSPTKKKTRNESSEDRIQCSFVAGRNKALDLTVIPCSQSQASSSSSSFEVLPPQRNESQVNAAGMGLSVSVSPTLRRQRQRSVLNLVVPTSQEDEIEISLMDGSGSLPRFSQLVREYSSMVGVSDTKAGEERLSVATRSQEGIEEKSQANNESKSSGQTGPSQSTQIRLINAILDDLDRLAEETRLNTTTVSQVLARPRPRIPNPSLSSENNSSGGQWQNLLMQSSVTEPDSSQWAEDPFSLTNEAYARHLGLRVSRPSTNTATTSRRHREWENAEGLPLSQPFTCTQSSATQPDSDEEDPFPTLPPPPAPPSTAETISNKGAGGSQAQSETESESETENEDDDCENGNGDDDEGMSMPDMTSPDDTFDFRLLSPREVRRVLENGMRVGTRSWRRDWDSQSFVLRSSRQGRASPDREEEEEGGEDDEGEEMPNTVREFLRMLDTQNQSLDWSQSQEQN